MAQPFGSYPFNAAGTDPYVIPQIISAMRAPTSQDIYPQGWFWANNAVTPPVMYQCVGQGVWESGGNAQATTTSAGITRYATYTEVSTGTGTDNASLAADVYTYINSVAIAGAPAATETTPGIAEIATQAETDTGTDDTKIITPLKLKTVIGNASYPASFTTLASSGATTLAAVGGAVAISSDTASNFSVTGAGVDLTLASAAGRVIVNGEEAAANAITLLSAAGGIDADAALQINIASSQNAADAIRIVASAGGIDVDAVGAAGDSSLIFFSC